MAEAATTESSPADSHYFTMNPNPTAAATPSHSSLQNKHPTLYPSVPTFLFLSGLSACSARPGNVLMESQSSRPYLALLLRYQVGWSNQAIQQEAALLGLYSAEKSLDPITPELVLFVSPFCFSLIFILHGSEKVNIQHAPVRFSGGKGK
ncbi:hypothetical protein ACRALDRAFT_207946 [Sodiomyces alcalophilus JCM 7366]|uniref:uncharacterized protein n=1 Tax=Sodiomyces alcalophilus JCM 7366 TaxID=591952 RepID=UPI0039B42BCF